MRSAAYALSQIARWLDGAQAMVEAKAADHILLLLESSNSAVREWTCEIIGRLAGHKTTALAILQPCVRILSLSGGEYSPAIEQAMFALSEMAQSEDGAQAIFNAKATDHIFILLNSPVHEVRTLSCQLVGRLASHESTAPALLELKLCAQIVSLLGDEHPTVIGAAVFALSRITRWGNGAKAVAHAKATGHMLAAMDDMLILLESPSWEVRQCTCELVGRLAGHDSPGVLELKSCVRMRSQSSSDRVGHLRIISDRPVGTHRPGHRQCKGYGPHLAIT
ncbi:armadillo-type protein [Mycena galopus ATCC 62051]|nr:armadillo-type protein [Mycena galopus ATCC 62051]